MTVGYDRKTTFVGVTLIFFVSFMFILQIKDFPYYYDILVYVNMCKYISTCNITQKWLSFLNVTLDYSIHNGNSVTCDIAYL